MLEREGHESRVSASTMESSLFETSRVESRPRQSESAEMESPRSWMEPISLLDTLRLVREGKLQSSLVGKLRTEELLRSRLVRRGTWRRLSCSSLRGTGELVDTRRLSRDLRPWKTPAGRKSRTQPSRDRWFSLVREEKAAGGRVLIILYRT